MRSDPGCCERDEVFYNYIRFLNSDKGGRDDEVSEVVGWVVCGSDHGVLMDGMRETS